jgi:hypothetical protein
MTFIFTVSVSTFSVKHTQKAVFFRKAAENKQESPPTPTHKVCLTVFNEYITCQMYGSESFFRDLHFVHLWKGIRRVRYTTCQIIYSIIYAWNTACPS